MIWIALFAAATAAGLFLACRIGRLLAASVAVLAVAGIGFGLAFLAIATDFRDADGSFDCWPDCSTFQDAVGTGIVYTPVAIIIGVVGFILGVALVSNRETR